MLRVILFLMSLLVTLSIQSQNLPEGFFLEEVTDQIPYPVGMVHTGTQDSYVWSQDGKVWLMRDDQTIEQAVIDISDEVGFWSDHGMLGMALHPDFENNGWMYLMYVVDRYHLFHEAESNYDPLKNEYNQATIARITRYTIDLTNRDHIVPASRKIIIGTDLQNGIPITTNSHGIGTLMFGKDTSLLFTVGDGSAPGKDFVGQLPFPESAFDQQALDDGILSEAENIGAYRSQYLNSYCGKIIRIDPETGMGLNSNPFYDPERPDEPISKVWALGLRNPFRMTFYPSPTSKMHSSGPGDLLVGDVGDWSWEEINIVDGPGLNFGWPVYQGMDSYYLFRGKKVVNQDAPIGPGECDQTHFYFTDLIVQASADHNARLEHPCNEKLSIPASVATFVHQRPALTYANWVSDTTTTLTPGFSPSGKAVGVGINDRGSSLMHGQDFNGSSSIGGSFYTMDGYPDAFQNAYFHGDFQGWLGMLKFDANNQVTEFEKWTDAIGGIVQITENPYDKNLYIVTHDPHKIQKLSFEGNRKPVIISTPDTVFGPGPLEVTFDASASYDPEGDSLSFLWKLDGEVISREAIFQHTFTHSEPKTFLIHLQVADQEGVSSRKEIVVSVNNSPPVVDITSIQNGDLYSLLQSTEWPLEASVSDAEHGPEELIYEWTVFLHHNTHFHQESQVSTPTAIAHIQPLGCGIETYHYRIRLAVEDPLGLRTVREKLLYPNCDEIRPDFKIFPNPAQGFIALQAAGIEVGDVMIFLHDQIGRLQYKTDRNIQEGETIRLELPPLPSGLYVLQVVGENFRIRKKVMIAY